MYRRLGWTPPSAYIMFRYESYTAKELGKRTRTVEALFFREDALRLRAHSKLSDSRKTWEELKTLYDNVMHRPATIPI
jgi:hypothetical protein